MAEVVTSEVAQEIAVAHSEPGLLQPTAEQGLQRQVMSWSPNLMLVRHTMAAGWVGARHSHPHEQMVYVVRGHIVFEHPGGRFEAKTGDSFLVAGDVPHQASAVEDSEVLDVFTPYREDYAPKG